MSYVLKTGQANNGRVVCVPLKVSYVNLTNRSIAFREWLEQEASPLVAGRFINHLNLGSSMLWSQSWDNAAFRECRCNRVGVAGLAKPWQSASRKTLNSFILKQAHGWFAVFPWCNIKGTSFGFTSPPSGKAQGDGVHMSGQGGWAGVGAPPRLAPGALVFVGRGQRHPGWRLRELGPEGAIRRQFGGGWFETFNSWLRLNGARIGTWDLAWFVDAGNVWLHGDMHLP